MSTLEEKVTYTITNRIQVHKDKFVTWETLQTFLSLTINNTQIIKS